MSTVVRARPRRVSLLVLHAEDATSYVILAFLVVSSLAGAFTHMHDWTRTALPVTADWLCWSNAVISELLPVASFLSWRKRQRQGRSTRTPLIIFLGSAGLSLCAQLSATGVRLPYDTQFLACLPALALLILSKVILGDAEHARVQRATVEAELAARAEREHAELAAREERERAELAAELAAREDRERAAQAAAQVAAHAAALERRKAELAAEVDRRKVELAAKLDGRQAELAAGVERARIEAGLVAERDRGVRAEQRAERDAAKRREAAEQRRLDEVAQVEAQARADLAAGAKRQATATLAAAESNRPAPATAGAGRQRRAPGEAEAMAQAVLDALPAGTTRTDAIAAVCARLSVKDRYARSLVPADWPASGAVVRSGPDLHLVG